MYSVKEKLNHFRQLSNPSVAEADLALLKDKSPGNSNLIRYGLAPSKNAEDILFDLLDVVTHDEIVRNRREFLAAQEAEEETDNIPDGNKNPNPDGNKNPNPDGEKNPEDEKNEIPVALGEKQEDETPKDDDNPADEKPTDETPAPKVEEVEEPNEETPTETAEEAEQVTVPEEAPATEAEEVEEPKEETPTEAVEEAEQPATEKKSTSPKKKSTPK